MKWWRRIGGGRNRSDGAVEQDKRKEGVGAMELWRRIRGEE